MTGQDIFGLSFLALIALLALLIAASHIRAKIKGEPINNAAAWEKKHPKPPELRAMPYRFRWWHVLVFLVQAWFVGWMTYAYWKDKSAPPNGLFIIFLMNIAICAFLTACLTRLCDWIVQRLRRLKGHSSEPSSDSLSTIGTRRSLSQTAEKRQRIGVRD